MKLIEGVKIFGTVTGDFFMINQLFRMHKFKILISYFFQVPKRGYRHWPPKFTKKYRLIALKKWVKNVVFCQKNAGTWVY